MCLWNRNHGCADAQHRYKKSVVIGLVPFPYHLQAVMPRLRMAIAGTQIFCIKSLVAATPYVVYFATSVHHSIQYNSITL